MSQATHAYIGRHPVCGHIRAAVIDDHDHANDTAKDVADFIASGMIIERVTVEYVRANFANSKCDVCEPPKAKQLSLAGQEQMSE